MRMSYDDDDDHDILSSSSLNNDDNNSLDNNINEEKEEKEKEKEDMNSGIKQEQVQVHQSIAEEAKRLRAAQLSKNKIVNDLNDEIKTLKMLLETKDEVIGKLHDEKQEMAEVMNLQTRQVQELEKALSRRKEGLGDLEHQLKQSEEEFEMLGEALEEKDGLLKTKNTEIYDLEEKVKELQKEIDKQKVMLRRVQAKPKVQTEEVCLSARSFTENELISLRDDAIQVKESQISIINENNNHLQQCIEHLEKEMERMQFDMVQKERQLTKVTLENEENLRRINDLKKQVQIKEGRETAMEVATKQNTQLLQLLQQQETLTKELDEKNRKLEDELEDTIKRTKNVLKRCSEFEVQSTMEHDKVLKLEKELLNVKSTWADEEETLRRKLSKLESESSKTIEKQQEEIRNKREKYYQVLEKLQVAQENERKSEENTEYYKSQMDSLLSRNKELDSRVLELHQWMETLEEKHHGELTKQLKQIEILQKNVETIEMERNALSVQLHEMSGTVLKAVNKQKGAVEKNIDLQTEIETKRAQLEEMKRALVKEGNLQGKRRMKVELEQKNLQQQLKLLSKENAKLAFSTNANFEKQQELVEQLEQKCKQLEKKLEKAKLSETNRLERLTTLIRSSCFLKENNLNLIDLSDCHLDNGCSLVTLCRHLSKLISNVEENEDSIYINLQNNNFKDEHLSNALCSLVQARFNVPSVTIDLQQNKLSTLGIQKLVLSLSKNPKVKHVYVHRDGKVQGLCGTQLVYTVDCGSNLQHSEEEEIFHKVSLPP